MASQLLRSLDLRSLTRELSMPSFEERSIKDKFLDLEKSLSLPSTAPLNQPLPLHVTLSSLIASRLEGQSIMVNTLVAQCHDPTSRVKHLMNNLAIIYAAAGLNNLSSLRPSLRLALKTTGLSIPRVSLIKTSGVFRGKIVPSTNHPGKMGHEKRPTFDSRDLVRTFRDFVWAENIRLERVSICQLGLTNHILEAGSNAQLSEACSVSLD